MNIQEQLDMESISEICLISNTPKFLYKRLRANSSIERFAKDHTVESIVKNYRKIIKKKERTYTENALAYALLVALHFKNYAELRRATKRLPVKNLKWGKDLKDILTSSAIPTIYTTAKMPQRIGSFPILITKNESTSTSKIIIASH